MAELILGSSSPRRREILSTFSLPFVQASPPFDERSVAFTGDPIEYTRTIAEKKALSLAPSFPDERILCADTMVYMEGKCYGKPRTKEEAFQFLSAFAGKCHFVYTSVALLTTRGMASDTEKTAVWFEPLNAEQIRAYMAMVHSEDKAGGYAIQEGGSLIVSKIEGCYDNVMGLPLGVTQRLLKGAGIDLWHYLKS